MNKIIIIILFVITGFLSAIADADDKAGTGTLSGVIILKDSGPMVDLKVLLFSDSTGPPPLLDQYMRLPDSFARTDSRGFFSTELPAGKYYVGGKKHYINKLHGGPPRNGDLFFISKDKAHAPVLYIVEAGEHIDISIAVEDIPYEWPDARKGLTGIEGRILDQNGDPVKNAVVFGYVDPEMYEGLSFVSGYTDSEGKYLLVVHKGGKYYLRVMGKLGTSKATIVSGMKDKNDAEGEEHGIDVSDGQIMSNIDIHIGAGH